MHQLLRLPRAWLREAALGLLALCAVSTAAAAPVAPTYPPGFKLKPVVAQPVTTVARPPGKSAGLSSPSWVDPTFGTLVYQVTAGTDYPGATFVRHDYSRRQAFNADNTRFLVRSSNGYWLLYDAKTFQLLKRGGLDGSLRGLAGDAEAIWHPTDPRKLWYTDNGGSLVWYEKDVEGDADTVMVDFRGKLPWPNARSVWTRREGTSSADGRYLAFVANTYDESSKEVKPYGLLTYDRVQQRIVGTLDAANFGGVMPDHISMSPSGRYVVPSWAYTPRLGTRAYTLDFSSFRQLHTESEHSDLALGPNGEDFLVFTNYKDGNVWAKDLATGNGFTLMRLYPRSGAGLGAAHFSGQAFGRPGWVLMSTYDDSSGHGKNRPDPVPEKGQRLIMLLELKPNGRQLSVAHTQTAERYGGYFGEVQATISRDGTRILFSTNFNDNKAANSYMIVLPKDAY
jgi:hypothetical protein